MPMVALHEEQVVGERVGPEVGVETVVGKVRRVAHQHAVHQSGVADHQERRPHLIEPAVRATGQLVVDALVRVHRVLGADGRAPKVTEQRYDGARERHVQVFPVIERPRAITVQYHTQKQHRPKDGHLPRRYVDAHRYLDQNNYLV